MTVLQKITIISGGQTGADRAALDFAIAHGIPHGGWCPRNRRAEDGSIGAQYTLRETPSTRYAQRTEWNVRNSDATVIFTIKPHISGGTRLTRDLALRLGKPLLHLSRDAGQKASNDGASVAAPAAQLINFLNEHAVQTLNIAGPRASQEADIASFVDHVLQYAWSDGTYT
ncbi:MAG TPA: putative molybdenum carrier protein [Lacipirellulaceae bacterium]|nr:putative molybdenum carrier protein [Lacipirellulaceae bacterium]